MLSFFHTHCGIDVRSSLFDCFARRIVRKPVLIAFFSRCMSAGTNPSEAVTIWLSSTVSLGGRDEESICNSPKRQRNAQQLYWEPETPQPTLVTKQESHITVWEKTYTVLFLYLKKNTYAFFNPTSKTHPRFFLPSKNTYAFLILNSRHIRVFGFDSKNTSAFFSPVKIHMRVFFISLNARHKKTQKNTKKHIPFSRFRTRSRPRGTDPDPSHFPFSFYSMASPPELFC